MRMPRLLLGATLLFWGWSTGFWIVAVPLALAVEALQRPGAAPLLTLGDAERTRIADLTSVAVALIVAYSLVTRGMPHGLLAAVGLMPIALAGLVLAQLGSGGRFRMRHVFYSMRRSRRPDAGREIDLLWPWFALMLLAGGIMTQRSVIFFVFLSMVVCFALYGLTQGAKSRVPFLLAFAIAGVGGFSLGEGVHRLQSMVEEWVLPYLADSLGDPLKAQTRIGDIGRVKLSERIVWRVGMERRDGEGLRLRDGVYSLYDGRSWLSRSGTFRPLEDGDAGRQPAADAGAATHYLDLAGSTVAGRAILPLPLGARPVSGVSGVVTVNAAGVVKLEEAPGHIRLGVEFSRTPRAVSEGEGSDLTLSRKDRELLARLDAAAPEVSRQALAHLPARERIAAVEGFFARNFHYTLYLGDEAVGGKDLERFLLRDRSGHCEYFATATVLLLRHLDVPARYVTGYSVSEFSRMEDAYVVRKRHAHAWVEAREEGRWVEVDTTPATWLGEEEERAPFWQPLLDLASWLWFSLQATRADDRSPWAWLGWAGAALGLAYLARAAWRRRNRREGEAPVVLKPAGGAYGEFEAVLAGLGYRREPGETPRAWIARLRKEGCPVLAEDRFSRADELVAAHYRQHYALGR